MVLHASGDFYSLTTISLILNPNTLKFTENVIAVPEHR